MKEEGKELIPFTYSALFTLQPQASPSPPAPFLPPRSALQRLFHFISLSSLRSPSVPVTLLFCPIHSLNQPFLPIFPHTRTILTRSSQLPPVHSTHTGISLISEFLTQSPLLMPHSFSNTSSQIFLFLPSPAPLTTMFPSHIPRLVSQLFHITKLFTFLDIMFSFHSLAIVPHTFLSSSTPLTSSSPTPLFILIVTPW